MRQGIRRLTLGAPQVPDAVLAARFTVSPGLPGFVTPASGLTPFSAQWFRGVKSPREPGGRGIFQLREATVLPGVGKVVPAKISGPASSELLGPSSSSARGCCC